VSRRRITTIRLSEHEAAALEALREQLGLRSAAAVLRVLVAQAGSGRLVRWRTHADGGSTTVPPVLGAVTPRPMAPGRWSWRIDGPGVSALGDATTEALGRAAVEGVIGAVAAIVAATGGVR
jgi:hypothetical protein